MSEKTKQIYGQNALKNFVPARESKRLMLISLLIT